VWLPIEVAETMPAMERRKMGMHGVSNTPFQRGNALDSGGARETCTELENRCVQRCAESARVTAS
jgi:hypothetical protein